MRAGPGAARTILVSGSVAGVLDLAFIVVYYLFKHVPAERVLHGVAAGGRSELVRWRQQNFAPWRGGARVLS